jgi:hypothetical protein
VDGVLGCNFFASHVVRIDFERGIVAFRASVPPVPDPCPSPVN